MGGHRSVVGFARDEFNNITMVLGILAIPSIFVGFYTKDMVVGMGTDFFKTAIYIPFVCNAAFDAEFIVLFYKNLPVNLSIFEILGPTGLTVFFSKISSNFHKLQS